MKSFFSLVLYRPDGGNQTWRLEEGGYSIGSDLSCGLVASCVDVEPVHTRVVLSAESLVVEDLGSATGTFVDGVRVEARVEVQYPAAIQVGSAIFSVNLEKGTKDKDAKKRGGSKGGAGKEDGVVDVRSSYPLGREVGRGGMGAIFEAEDTQLKRTIAVKVSTRGVGGDAARFFEEAEVLARLAHPNIVPVYSVGRNGSGSPAYSMKLLKGHTLHAILTGISEGDEAFRVQYPQDKLLTVFLKVCDAMAFAHSKGVLHRDLKPENVMVGEFGEVLVVDWGLAKTLGKSELRSDLEVSGAGGAGERPIPGGLVPRLDRTMDGDVLGTPQYMSPEQASGKVEELDERSDIYTLGALLYAILTLNPPVDGTSLDDVLAKVRAGAIKPIQKRIPKEMPGEEFVGLHQSDEVVPEALQAVVLKAMALRPEQRYQSVIELEAEIHSYRSGFATVAEQASFWRHLVLLMQRHRLESVMGGMFLIAMVLFTVKLAGSERELRESAQLAIQQKRMAEWNAKAAKKNELDAVSSQQKALEEREVATRSSVEARIAVAEAAEQRLDGKGVLNALMEVPKESRGNHQSWQYLLAGLDSSVLTVDAKDESRFVGVHPLGAQGGQMLTVQENGWVRGLDLRSGRHQDLFRVATDERVSVTAVSSNGGQLAFAVRNQDEQVKGYRVEIWSIPEAAWKVTLRSVPAPVRLRFNQDGKYLVSEFNVPVAPSTGSPFQIWETRSGRLVWEGGSTGSTIGEFVDSGIFRMLSVDDTHTEGVLSQVNLSTGEVLAEMGRIPYRSIPDRGHYKMGGQGSVLYGMKWGSLVKIGFKESRVVYESRMDTRGEIAIALLGRSKVLVTLSQTADRGGLLQYWNEINGRPLSSVFFMAKGAAKNWSLAVNPNSGEVVTVDGDQLKVWRFTVLSPVYTSSRLSSAGGYILQNSSYYVHWKGANSYSREGKLEVFDLNREESFVTPVYSEALGYGDRISVSQTGADFCVRADGRVWWYDLREGGVEKKGGWKSASSAGMFCLSPNGDRLWDGDGFYNSLDGKCLAVCDRAGIEQLGRRRIAVWVNSRILAEIVLLKGPESEGGGSGATRAIVLWDAETGALLKTVPAPNANSLGVSPDGTQIVEGGLDKRIRIRPVDTLEVERELRVHGAAVTGAVWHPTRPVIFTTSADATIKIWDATTGLLEEELGNVWVIPEDLSVSADGRFLSILSNDRSEVGLYDLEAVGRERSKK